jgi:hypothetical protein
MSESPESDDRAESPPRRYGLKGAVWGALSGAVVSVALLWLTSNYLSFAALPIIAAYGYSLRPGIPDPGPLKSRW